MSRPKSPKGRVKNACRICGQNVSNKGGVQCKGACARWAHFKCLGFSPQKILEIKNGIIEITCPCPHCNLERLDGELDKRCQRTKCQPIKGLCPQGEQRDPPYVRPSACDAPSCPELKVPDLKTTISETDECSHSSCIPPCCTNPDLQDPEAGPKECTSDEPVLPGGVRPVTPPLIPPCSSQRRCDPVTPCGKHPPCQPAPCGPSIPCDSHISPIPSQHGPTGKQPKRKIKLKTKKGNRTPPISKTPSDISLVSPDGSTTGSKLICDSSACDDSGHCHHTAPHKAPLATKSPPKPHKELPPHVISIPCSDCKCMYGPSLTEFKCQYKECPNKQWQTDPLPNAPPPTLKSATTCTAEKSKSCTCMKQYAKKVLQETIVASRSDSKIPPNACQTMLLSAIVQLCNTVGQLSGQIKLLMGRL